MQIEFNTSTKWIQKLIFARSACPYQGLAQPPPKDMRQCLNFGMLACAHSAAADQLMKQPGQE